MVTLLHMHALVVPLKVSLARKLLVAAVDLAVKGVLPPLVVGFQVRLVVVAAGEELSAAFNIASKGPLLLRRGRIWHILVLAGRDAV